MKRGLVVLFVAILVILSFLGGRWYSVKPAPGTAQSGGMRLDPVYADGEDPGGGAAGKTDQMMPGIVKISPEKQQIIGVRVATVERQPVVHTLRILGRAAAAENRTFRINASTELWIRKVYPPTTGSFVRKNEPLVAYYATNFLTAATSYMYALNTLDRQKAARMGQCCTACHYQ